MDSEVILGDIDLKTVKVRSIRGIATLIGGGFFLQTVAGIGFFALSIFLGRPEIGLFIAINDLVSILGYFSDIGFAASLIQKKGQVTVTDLRTVFTIQQCLVLGLILLVLTFSPFIFSFYHFTGAGSWLFFSLIAAFFMAALKTIPSVVLERQMHFEILTIIDVIESVIFYAVAVTMAWRGLGVMSYVYAVLLRGIVGTFLIYLLSPWSIGLGISKSSIKTLLSFGVRYQINSLMSVVKDRFINIALWRIIGADGVGIIGWAQTWSQKPLRIIMDNVTTVTFPAYARMQDHPTELRQAIEKTLFFITLATFPTLAGMAVLVPLAVHLIPKYGKWEVALIPLALYCFNSAWAAVSTPLTNTLNALGHVKDNTYLMIMWTTLTWVLTPALAIKFGFLGVAYATAIIALSSIVPVILVYRLTKFSLSASLLKPTLATLVMLFVSWPLSKYLAPSVLSLLLNFTISTAVFCVTIYLLVGQSLITDSTRLLHAFKKK